MITFALSYLRTQLGTLLRSERAQDGFEYMLVIGAVSIGIITLMVTPLGTTVVNAIIDGICTAIGTDLSIPGFPSDCTTT